MGAADDGIATGQDHVAFRRDVMGQAKSALEVSEQKAEKVASGAPTYAAKSAESKAKSGPMSGEAKGLAAKNNELQPDDADASAKTREQGDKIGKVGSDIQTVDDAVTQTQKKAEGLSEEAAEAKATNAQVQTKVGGTEAVLAKTEAHFGELKEKNVSAQAKLASLAGGPAQINAGADALDQQRAALIKAADAIEARLSRTQQAYQGGVRSIPAAKRKPPVRAAKRLLSTRQAAPPLTRSNALVKLYGNPIATTPRRAAPMVTRANSPAIVSGNPTTATPGTVAPAIANSNSPAVGSGNPSTAAPGPATPTVARSNPPAVGSASPTTAAPQPDGGERVNLDLGGKVASALPSWLTGEEPVSAEGRRRSRQGKRAAKRRDRGNRGAGQGRLQQPQRRR